MHSSLLVSYRGAKVMIDCGLDWLGKIERPHPNSIVLTHAHPDHAWGLEEGTAAPVHASAITHDLTAKMPIETRVVLEPGRPVRAGPFRMTAMRVVHSVRCPGIGVRLEVGGRTLVYSGDLVSFEDPDRALAGADVYVGDGSTLRGSLVRRHASGALLGHTTVRAQLGWLAKRGIGRAVFSHFGKEAIAMGEEALREALAKLVSERLPGAEVTAARDGLTLDS